MTILCDVGSPHDTWLTMLAKVYHDGRKVGPRDIATFEVLDPTIVISQPWQVPFEVAGRDFRSFIGAAEALQLVSGVSRPEWMVQRVKAFDRFREADGRFHGAYGPRIAARMGDLVNLLARDPQTRQAVLSIYDARQDLRREPPKDVPCTLSVQFMIREHKLNMRVSMRSNDVWLGLPYDMVQFAALQGAVAAALDVPMGTYTHTVASMHLYASDAPKAVEVLSAAQHTSDYKAYAPMWSASNAMSIAGVTGRAGAILLGNGRRLLDPTPFEMWLMQMVEEG